MGSFTNNTDKYIAVLYYNSNNQYMGELYVIAPGKSITDISDSETYLIGFVATKSYGRTFPTQAVRTTNGSSASRSWYIYNQVNLSTGAYSQLAANISELKGTATIKTTGFDGCYGEFTQVASYQSGKNTVILDSWTIDGMDLTTGPSGGGDEPVDPSPVETDHYYNFNFTSNVGSVSSAQINNTDAVSGDGTTSPFRGIAPVDTAFPVKVTLEVDDTFDSSKYDFVLKKSGTTIESSVSAETVQDMYGNDVSGLVVSFTLSAMSSTELDATDTTADEYTLTATEKTTPTPEPEPDPGPTTEEASTAVTTYIATSDFLNALQKAVFITADGAAQPQLSGVKSAKQVFDTITSTLSQTAKVGNYSLQVVTPYITDFSRLKDLGTIAVPSHFNNADDYVGTSIKLYAPLVGYIDLDPQKCIGHNIHIIYKYEVITCRALVLIYSDFLNKETIIAQSECNFGIDIPIAGDTSTYTSSYWDVLTSQLGELTPYLLIERINPLTDISEVKGKKTQKVVKVSDVTGYVKFDTIFLKDIPAESKELDQILTYLTTGVLVN